MTISQCYEMLGGDYQQAISRFQIERLVVKFAVMFKQDESFVSLKKALQENNAEEAFRHAHTLKGVCANLSFTKLYNSAGCLTESLRNGTFPDNLDQLFSQVEEDYQATIYALNQLSN